MPEHIARSRPHTLRFDGLVRDRQSTVLRAAWRVTRSTSEAEDVTQEVFLSLLEGKINLERARDPEAVLSWFGAKTALARKRSESARKRREARKEESMQSVELNDATSVSVDDERRARVQEAVGSLPEKLRSAIVLRFQEGLTLARVAVALGISEKSASRPVQQGLAKLELRLGEVGLGGLGTLQLAQLLPRLLGGAAPAPTAALAARMERLVQQAAEGSLVPSGGTSLAVWKLASAAALVIAAAVGGARLWQGNTSELGVAAAPGGSSNLHAAGESAFAVEDGGQVVERQAAPQADTGSTLPRARITGRLVEEDGSPVADATVALMGRTSSAERLQQHGSPETPKRVEVVSDETGALSLELDPHAGEMYRMVASAPGRCRVS